MSRKANALLGVLIAALACAVPLYAGGQDAGSRLDRELRARAQTPRGSSRVIVRLQPGAPATAAEAAIRGVRGIVGRRLASILGQVAYVPDSALESLGRLPGVSAVSLDRRIQGTLERTGATIGATWVRENLGLDGTGIGIALIDSGVANWHDDLGNGRVSRFVDFVNFQPVAYDDYGHGTHVAGIIAGDGHDSEGRRHGIAPGATLLVEKVLDAAGQGYISNVIAAIDYAVANKDELNIRVINLSVAAGVYESYTTDPLTLAARRAVDAGIVVVSAAGNLGRDEKGETQHGGIGAPGNAPWVLTVGASNHNGTVDRGDDTVAGFSSRGPTAIDFQAKPDIVAPGVGIESIAEAGSTLWNTKPLNRLWGSVPTATEPYLSLSGTSMAAPVVSATIALMLQANPSLTPSLVKSILQYTAENNPKYDAFAQGAGFLNSRGAVELSRTVASGASIAEHDDPTPWSGEVVSARPRVTDEALATASPRDNEGDASRLGAGNFVWGTQALEENDNIVWGAPAIRRESRVIVTVNDASSK